MLNDFFEQETVDTIGRWARVITVALGVLLLVGIVRFAIDRVQQNMDALQFLEARGENVSLGESQARADEIAGALTREAEATRAQELQAAAVATEQAMAAEAAVEASAGAENSGAENTGAENTGAADNMEAVAAAFGKATCGSCHIIPGIENSIGVIGPDLTAIGATAATRIDGYSAEEYIRESIVNPAAYIVPDCPAGACLAGLMQPAFAQVWSEEELDLVVQYLVSLQE